MRNKKQNNLERTNELLNILKEGKDLTDDEKIEIKAEVLDLVEQDKPKEAIKQPEGETVFSIFDSDGSALDASEDFGLPGFGGSTEQETPSIFGSSESFGLPRF